MQRSDTLDLALDLLSLAFDFALEFGSFAFCLASYVGSFALSFASLYTSCFGGGILRVNCMALASYPPKVVSVILLTPFIDTLDDSVRHGAVD